MDLEATVNLSLTAQTLHVDKTETRVANKCSMKWMV